MILSQKTLKAFSIIALSFLGVSCTATNSVQPTELPVPAVRVNVTPEAQNELQRTVAQSLHLNHVILAKHALVNSDTLFMQRKVLLGNDMGRPSVFKLVKINTQCILVNQKSKQRYLLAFTQCEFF